MVTIPGGLLLGLLELQPTLVTDALGYCRGGSELIADWTNNNPDVEIAYGDKAIEACRGHSMDSYPSDATVFRVADNAPDTAWTVPGALERICVTGTGSGHQLGENLRYSCRNTVCARHSSSRHRASSSNRRR